MKDGDLSRKITSLAEEYPSRASALLPVLELLQGRAGDGRLTRENVRTAAEALGLPPSRVWGAATYYGRFQTSPVGKYHLRVDTGVPALLAGSDSIVAHLEKRLGVNAGSTTGDGLFTLSTVEDLGAAGVCPVMTVNDRYFGPLTEEAVDGLLSSLREGEIPSRGDRTFYRSSCGILLGNRGVPAAAGIRVYREGGGYGALAAASVMEPEEIVSLVEESGLRGRGGAGFPTGRKWRYLPRDHRPRYLICNADEGEPGTFKDRQIMEYDPHLLVEGIALAARAIGAHRAFVYIRGDYRILLRVVEKAAAEAREAGLLPEVEITTHLGAGSYICGEESALIASLEGRRGEPRPRPPYPSESGLYGCPTIVHNVETLALLPFLVDKGVERFRGFGTPGSPGPALFSVSGHVGRPGIYEEPCGIPLAELLEGAGGVRGNLKAVIVGGLTSPILRADEAEGLALDHDSCSRRGGGLGSGAVIVMNEETDIPQVALRTARFAAGEACGRCLPCSEGTFTVMKLLERLVAGRGDRGDYNRALEICRGVKGNTLCPGGEFFARSLEAMLEKFEGEFEGLWSRR
jgi:NADH:ubiquinone oxidoreductase subunit F (NADH-binding)/NADH:ubiquinone oxidoreductase subunit E